MPALVAVSISVGCRVLQRYYQFFFWAPPRVFWNKAVDQLQSQRNELNDPNGSCSGRYCPLVLMNEIVYQNNLPDAESSRPLSIQNDWQLIIALPQWNALIFSFSSSLQRRIHLTWLLLDVGGREGGREIFLKLEILEFSIVKILKVQGIMWSFQKHCLWEAEVMLLSPILFVSCLCIFLACFFLSPPSAFILSSSNLLFNGPS